MAYFIYNNKNVYYKLIGHGEPLLLLHGNTVSSKMFSSIIKMYVKDFRLILIDFPGHGKSERLEQFDTDFWFSNSEVCYALIKKLGFEKLSVVGTSGGALVGINLALEHPEFIKYLIADSFEGAYPLASYIKSLEADRKRDQKKLLAKAIWFYCHGFDWKRIVDLDTEMNIKFDSTGKSFFHKSIADLKTPSLITGSLQDEYCDHLNEIYENLRQKNSRLEVHLFEKGKHPAILSNKIEFYKLVKEKLNKGELNIVQNERAY